MGTPFSSDNQARRDKLACVRRLLKHHLRDGCSVTNSLHKRFSLHPTTSCQNKLTKADVGGNLICLHLHISSGKMVNANFFEVDMFVGVFPHGFACST